MSNAAGNSVATEERPRMKRVVAVLAVLAPLAVAPARAETLNVGNTGVVSDAPFFIAAAEGYFREEGLDVNFTRFDSAAKMIAPLGAGQLDAGGGATSAALFNAAKRDIKIRIVADKARNSPGYGFQALMLRKDLIDSGKVHSVADLKGMKIAVSAKGNSEAFVLSLALAKGGLKLSDIDQQYLGFPDQPPALANKAIDGAISTEPTISFLEKSGTAERYIGVDKIFPDYQTAVTYLGADFIHDKAPLVPRFMHALLRGMRFYVDSLKDGKLAGPNAARTIDILVQYGTIKDPAVYRAATPSGLDPDGNINMDSLRATWQFFKDSKQIDGSVTMDDIVDMSFAKAAVQMLGPYHPKQ
jgi:NitT/TauT family transport system substrate-binding protein